MDCYHGTSHTNTASIINNGFRPSDGDNEWLCDGIYTFIDRGLKNPIEAAEKWSESRAIKSKYQFGAVPQYAVEFTDLILIYMLIDALFCPLWLFVDATGKIRTHQIVTGLLILSNIPIEYVLQKMHFSPNSVWYARIIINVVANIFRLVYMLKVFRFPSCNFVVKVIIPVCITSVIVVFPTWYVYSFFDDSILNTIFL